MGGIHRSKLSTEDTLFALATGALPSAVAILRVSGPLAFEVASRHFSKTVKHERAMHFGLWRDALERPIDSIVLLAFVAPHSLTGQDVIEIQCHGSLAVVRAIEKTLIESGLRPAERGEFSLRAFYCGKASSEWLQTLGDLFLTKEPAHLGALYRRRGESIELEVGLAREALIRAQAIFDTAVDFSEEYSAVVRAAEHPLKEAIDHCNRLVVRYRAVTVPNQAPRIVLAGSPNAGKSSLFNALLCRYRAIVHETAGTTRDAIEEDIELDGRAYKLVDTAGFRRADQQAEIQGIELGEDYLKSASYWLLAVDGVRGMGDEERGLLERFSHIPHGIVWNKQDLQREMPPKVFEVPVWVVSAKTGDGIAELANGLSEEMRQAQVAVEGPLPYGVQAAQLDQAVAELRGLMSDVNSGTVAPEVLGEKNRGVLRVLEAIVGPVDVEAVLDRVFGEFCIGK